jgi:sugar phosphate isomerase/epimerase
MVLTGIGDEAAADLTGQLAAVAELGWNHLELRTVGGVPIAQLDDAAFFRAVERLRAADVAVICVAAKIGDWSRPVTGDFALDLTELKVLGPRCAALGTRLVRVMSYPSGGLDELEWGRRARSRLRELARYAEDAGLLLAHENCAGWAGDRAERMLDLIADIDSPALRLLFDTGNGVAHGYPSVPMLRAILEQVVHVHIKDAVIGPDGSVAYVPPGTGQAGVAECLRLLFAHGYSGALSIEPHLRLRPHVAAGDAASGHGGRAASAHGDRPVVGRGAFSGSAQGDRAAFVACGRALERLVAQAADGLPADRAEGAR